MQIYSLLLISKKGRLGHSNEIGTPFNADIEEQCLLSSKGPQSCIFMVQRTAKKGSSASENTGPKWQTFLGERWLK